MNSGDLPIKDLPISLIFDPIEDFEIIASLHETTPKYEFGGINETRNNNSIRFVYSLLNPADTDLITIIANKLSQPELYAESEGLSIHKINLNDVSEDKSKLYSVYLAVFVSIFTMMISILLKPDNEAAAEAIIHKFNPFISKRAKYEEIEYIKDHLGLSSADLRKKAALKLGYIGSPEAIDPLIEVLKDPDEYVRMAAVKALGKIGEDFEKPN